jgi:hypothetical protein
MSVSVKYMEDLILLYFPRRVSGFRDETKVKTVVPLLLDIASRLQIRVCK